MKTSLRKLTAKVLHRAVSIYQRANPGFYASTRNRTTAYLFLTDSWGAIRRECQSAVAQAMKEAA